MAPFVCCQRIKETWEWYTATLGGASPLGREKDGLRGVTLFLIIYIEFGIEHVFNKTYAINILTCIFCINLRAWNPGGFVSNTPLPTVLDIDSWFKAYTYVLWALMSSQVS